MNLLTNFNEFAEKSGFCDAAKYQSITPFETVCLLANSMNLLSKINEFGLQFQ